VIDDIVREVSVVVSVVVDPVVAVSVVSVRVVEEVVIHEPHKAGHAMRSGGPNIGSSHRHTCIA
jgi:hypothetical protein